MTRLLASLLVLAASSGTALAGSVVDPGPIVPEPGAGLLMALGLGIVYAVHRSRR